MDRETAWVKALAPIFTVRKMVANACGELMNLIKEYEFYIHVNV